MPNTIDDRTILLYDRDCRFCRWAVQQILRWDRRGRLRPVALQEAEAPRLLAHMDEERRMASWHLVTPDGEISSAGRAIAPLLRVLPGGRALASLADALPRLTDAGYALLARIARRSVASWPFEPAVGGSARVALCR